MKFGTVPCASCAMALAFTGTAFAQSVPGLDLQVSHDGVNWDENTVQTAGETIYVRVVMTIPESFYGIAGSRFNIVSEAGQWDLGGNDTVSLTPGKGSTSDGRRSGFDFGGQTQQIFETGNRLRIDAKGDNGDNVNAGISVSQNLPSALGTHFNTNKVAEVYRFSVNISSGTFFLNGGLVRLTIHDGSVPGFVNQVTAFRGYADISSNSGTQIPSPHGDSAYIAIPAPAATPLGILVLAMGTRRRR